MPSRLGRRAVRRLVRRHRRRPGRPGVRPVVVATALVIVCAATVQLAVVSRTTISTTSTGPATVPQGSLGRIARAAGVTVPGAGTGITTCASDTLGAPTASLSLILSPCTTGFTTTTHEAWSNLQAAEARETRARARQAARERAAERRAEKREAREAKRRAAERRAEKRAARAAAERRAEKRQAQKRAAERARARRAARQARQRASSNGNARGWRNAPIVTWYGPGFYGNRTACGVKYTRDIVGVAHRTLPCGTLVEFRWNGITAVAPVIDRGPFASSAYVFDFSAAMSCEVFKPRGVDNACFTRYDVKYRVVGKVGLKAYLRRQ